MPDPADPPARPASAPTDERSSMREWHRMAGVGIEFAVAVVGLGFLGYWVDGLAGTRPWLMFAGLALGFAVGLVALLRAAKKMF